MLIRKRFYVFSLSIGIAVFVYFYIVVFNDISQEQLMKVVPFWLLPAVFGLYGIIGQRMIPEAYKKGKRFYWEDFLILLFIIILSIITYGLGVLLILIPGLIFRKKYREPDLIMAVSGTLLWLMLFMVYRYVNVDFF